MHPRTTITTFVSLDKRRDLPSSTTYISGVHIVCDNEEHREDIRRILASGPVLISQLAPSTVDEVLTTQKARIRMLTEDYEKELQEIEDTPYAFAHEQNAAVNQAATTYASQIHAVNDWVHDELERLKDHATSN